MMKDYLMLATRSIFKRRLRSWLTMIGIFIGIAAVVALVSLGQGLEHAITGQFASFGTDKLIIQAAGSGFGPPGSTVVEKLTSDDADVVRKVAGIEIVAERLIRTGAIKFNDEQRYSFIASITQDESRHLVLEALDEMMDVDVMAGRMLTKEDNYKIVVGSGYFEDKLYTRNLKLGDSLRIGTKDFEIVGFLVKSASIFGNDFVLMNDKPMREVLDIEDEVDLIAARVESLNKMNATSERVERALRKHRDVELGKEDFTVQTPEQALESLNKILNYVTWFLVFIAMISLLVGAIGIMNTMYTAVLERTKEIGIMKSVGAKNSSIMLLFLIESGILGLVGGLIGVALGVLLSKSVEVIAALVLGTQLIQAHFTLTWILGPLLFAVFVGSASGVFPAMQAAKLRPVDALRK